MHCLVLLNLLFQFLSENIVVIGMESAWFAVSRVGRGPLF